MSRMRSARRKRGECEGEWRCDNAASIVQTRVRKAATGWTMRIDGSEERALLGSVKSESLSCVLKSSFQLVSIGLFQDHYELEVTFCRQR